MRKTPSRWREGDVILIASAPVEELAAEASLVRFLWKAAPLLTLAHDVGDQGLEAALAEAALWSGVGAQLNLPEEPAGGAAVLACAPDDVELLGSRGLKVIGAAGGDELLGFGLDELREAHEG